MSDPRGVAFLRCFVRHQQEIYAYILTMVPNLHDADDLFQEGLTEAHVFEGRVVLAPSPDASTQAGTCLWMPDRPL